MKKIILSIAAMLTFSIASAQINPDQPQQTQPDPANAVVPDEKNKADRNIDVPIDAKTIEEPKHSVINDGEPRKDDLTTKDHVKSTPDPTVVNSEEKQKKAPKKASAKRKKS